MERRGRTEAWPPGGLWIPTAVTPEKSLETETDADAWLARRGKPGTKELTENPGTALGLLGGTTVGVQRPPRSLDLAVTASFQTRK